MYKQLKQIAQLFLLFKVCVIFMELVWGPIWCALDDVLRTISAPTFNVKVQVEKGIAQC